MTAQESPTGQQHDEHVKDLAALLRQIAAIGSEHVPNNADMSTKMDRMNRALSLAGDLGTCSDAYVAKFGQDAEDVAYKAALDQIYGEGN